MSMLEKHIAFVNEQIGVQRKLAQKFSNDQWRQGMHISSCEKFEMLSVDLLEANRLLDERASRPPARPATLTLKEEDLEGLPPELLEELSEGAVADKGESAILQIINENGGVASLDQVLVGYFRKTGEVMKRPTMTSKLYRMSQKRTVFGVPNRKGVYAAKPLTEDESAVLFGSDGQEDAAPPTPQANTGRGLGNLAGGGIAGRGVLFEPTQRVQKVSHTQTKD